MGNRLFYVHCRCLSLKGFMSYPIQSSLVIRLCLMSPPMVFASLSFIGLWPIHPVLPDPSDPQTHTNTGFTKCVCVCPFPLVSQRKWEFGRKPLLAVSSVSFFVLCDVPAVFLLEYLSCYFDIIMTFFYYFES